MSAAEIEVGRKYVATLGRTLTVVGVVEIAGDRYTVADLRTGNWTVCTLADFRREYRGL